MSRLQPLLDTGPLVALLDKNDEKHEEAKELFGQVPAPLLTCESVISEACFLLQKVGPLGPREIILQGIRGLYEIPLSLTGQWPRMNDLFRKYGDQEISLADASLIVLAECYEQPHILTFDSDFEVYRWGKNRKFTIIQKPF